MRLTSRLLAAVVGAAAVLSATAFAETTFQTQSYTATTSGSAFGQTLTWNKFDTSLGELTGVSLLIDGTSAGSINVANSDVDAITLFNFVNKVRLQFSGTGTKPGAQTTSDTAITTSPSIPISPSSYTLGGESDQTFSLSPSDQTLAGLSNTFGAFLAYFNGPGTFSTSVFQLPAVGTSNAGFTTVDNSLLTTTGNVSFTYTYTPVAVPEPSTYALAAMGLAGLAVLRRRRLKSA